jgi:hypothetical protein
MEFPDSQVKGIGEMENNLLDMQAQFCYYGFTFFFV